MPDFPLRERRRKEREWMTNLLLVIIGGAIGAGGRYLLSGRLHAQLGSEFPWGTFAVNVLGSLVIGLISGLAERGNLSSGASLFLTVGVLGGFTTFSVFSYETLRLLEAGNFAASLLNVFGQLTASVVAVYLGFAFTRLLVL